MSRLCDNCGRGAMVGNTRSHSNIASKVRRMVNLQWKTINGDRRKLCTRCIRTTKTKATA